MAEKNSKSWTDIRSTLDAAVQDTQNFIAAREQEIAALETTKVGLEGSIAQLRQEEKIAGIQKQARVLDPPAAPVEFVRVSADKLDAAVKRIEAALAKSNGLYILDQSPVTGSFVFRSYGDPPWQSRSLTDAELVHMGKQTLTGQSIESIIKPYVDTKN